MTADRAAPNHIIFFMLTILLLRHGESADRQMGELDSHRKLTKRGRASIERLALYLKEREFKPEIFLSSDAIRAAETIEMVTQVFQEISPVIVFDSFLYHGLDNVYLNLIQDYFALDRTIILVGHNPTLSSVAGWLTGNHVALSPGQMAVVQVEAREEILKFGAGALVEVIGPFMK